MRTRYRQERTLVRRLCRLPGEDRAAFKRKVSRLKEHFEQFNVDTAELCQWFFGLRKEYVKTGGDDPASFGLLGDFLLEPGLEGVEADDNERDGWRLAVFDDVVGFRSIDSLAGAPLPAWLRDAMDAAAAARPHEGAKNACAARMFDRLKALHRAHRLVLLKAAAEWVVARYKRGVENWKNGHAAWKKERDEWEAANPELTPEVRDDFAAVFKQLKDDEREDKPGLRRKNPRLCRYERLRENIDNCCYAGQKGHGPLCGKYAAFVKAHKQQDKRFNAKAFWEAASILAELCNKHRVRRAGNALQSQHILDALFAEHQRRREERQKAKGKPTKQRKSQNAPNAKADFIRIFKTNWNAYLKAMELNDTTAIEKGCLPHCRSIGNKFENTDCIWNPHTDYCAEYKRRLEAMLDPATIEFEELYRIWRKDYLAGPRKPSFKYPSSRDLPMPKIFGKGFHEIDFHHSILRLRLDDMAEGEWTEFGFTPWPRGYTPSRKQIAGMVSSVNVTFIGNRARIGFRFAVEHKASRFAVTQDAIDELRSKKFPRQADDQKFLDTARSLLLDSFDGDAKRELRVLAVDLGMTNPHAAVFQGNRYESDAPVPIIKINKVYSAVPEKLERDPKDRRMRGPLEFSKDDPRGLRKEHIGRHLQSIAVGAAKIAEHRQKDGPPMTTLEKHDFRGPKRHIAWMVRDWSRLNAKQIIDAAEEHRCDLIVFESLRGRRMPGYEKLDEDSQRKKAEGVIYAYGRVRRKVMEKAVERGMRVVTVPYHNSSKVCSVCGHVQQNPGLLQKNKLSKRKFICEDKKCAAETNSDANAARLLARVFWGEIKLPAPTKESRSKPKDRQAELTAPAGAVS